MSAEATACFPDTLSNTTGRTNGGTAPTLETGKESADSPTNTMDSGVDLSDESLLERVGRGEKDALGQLFRRYARTVRNVGWRILRNGTEADDLVQDVFIFLFRKAALFKATHGSARSWIVHVTYHQAFNRRCYLNTRHFYTSHDLEQVMLTASQHHSERWFVEWSLEGVWGKESAAKLRELLSPSQLLTIQLHFFEGYTLDEIAERLGQKLANVRHHYYRGLEKLRHPDFANQLRTK